MPFEQLNLLKTGNAIRSKLAVALRQQIPQARFGNQAVRLQQARHDFAAGLLINRLDAAIFIDRLLQILPE